MTFKWWIVFSLLAGALGLLIFAHSIEDWRAYVLFAYAGFMTGCAWYFKRVIKDTQ